MRQYFLINIWLFPQSFYVDCSQEVNRALDFLGIWLFLVEDSPLG